MRVLGRSVGQRLAGQCGRDAANDLEQSRTARVDDPGFPENGELVRRARERVLATLDQLLRRRRGLEVGVAGTSASSASSRITESIVPSTGRRTAR